MNQGKKLRSRVEVALGAPGMTYSPEVTDLLQIMRWFQAESRKRRILANSDSELLTAKIKARLDKA